MWCFQIKPVESKRQSIALLVIVLLSICVDFDWLSSRYLAGPLEDEGQGNIFAYRIEQEDSLVHSIAWYGILINVFLKAVSLNFSLQSSKRGSLVRSKFWERVNVFCTFIASSHEDVTKAVQSKLVAVLWMELTSSIIVFSSFFIIDIKGVSSELFQDGPTQLLSLQASLLYKGASSVIFFLSLFHHIRLKDFLAQFGCTSCCPEWGVMMNSEARGRRRLIPTLKKSMKCIVVAKISDFAIGVLLWINLASAHKKFTRDEPKDAIVLFALLVSTQTMTCILSPILCFIAAW